MKHKSRCSDVLAGLKGSVIGQVKPDIKRSHSKLDLESSTWAVSQRKQPRQAWKMLKPCGPLTQHDAIMDNNINKKSGRYRGKPGMTSLFNVRLTPDLYNYNSGQHAGFTLIELLVVVLIIGILASIALPQYQKAVEKSKATQAITLLKSLYQAEEVYYLANGHFAALFEELDIEIPWNGTEAWHTNATDVRSNGEWSLQLYAGNDNFNITIGRMNGKYRGAGFFLLPTQQVESDTKTGMIYCAERTDAGITFTGAPGDYCEKVMQATPTTGSWSSRYYLLP